MIRQIKEREYLVYCFNKSATGEDFTSVEDWFDPLK